MFNRNKQVIKMSSQISNFFNKNTKQSWKRLYKNMTSFIDEVYSPLYDKVNNINQTPTDNDVQDFFNAMDQLNEMRDELKDECIHLKVFLYEDAEHSGVYECRFCGKKLKMVNVDE